MTKTEVAEQPKTIRLTKRMLIQALSDAYKAGKDANFADLASFLVEALKLGKWGAGYK